MIDTDKLDRLARAAGSGEWTPTYSSRIEQAHVLHDDGDAVCQCFDNMGHQTGPINGDDIAEFIATVSPSFVINLVVEIQKLRRQSVELSGVVIDVEQGRGFDDACLATIKRVIGVLDGKP